MAAAMPYTMSMRLMGALPSFLSSSPAASPLPNRPDRSSANRASNRSAAPLTHFTHMGEREQRSHHRRHRHLRVSVVVNKRLFVAMASEGVGTEIEEGETKELARSDEQRASVAVGGDTQSRSGSRKTILRRKARSSCRQSPIRLTRRI